MPPKTTTVRVIVKVLDENDNRPLFLEKIYKIQIPERERPERERAMRRDPVYRVIASDRDEGPNAEISYSIEEGDEHGKFFIEPKTGLVSSKKFSSAGEYDILTVSILSEGFTALLPGSLPVSSKRFQQMLVYCFTAFLSFCRVLLRTRFLFLMSNILTEFLQFLTILHNSSIILCLQPSSFNNWHHSYIFQQLMQTVNYS